MQKSSRQTLNQKKNPTKIAAMREGGPLLGQIRDSLVQFTQLGMSFAEIEAEAQRQIAAVGAKPNFAMVPGYHWATCIMRNDEMCHGIPTKEKHVKDGDLITIDIGMLYQGFHLDTTTSFLMGEATPEAQKFLEVGKSALAKAISKATAGNTVYDISQAMQKGVERHGYSLVYQLCGHGVGDELHEDPEIPCLAQRGDRHKTLYDGQTIAVEVMYAMGSAYLVVDPDGWTYRTQDGSLAGMIEETVLVTEQGPEILTQVSSK